MATTITITFEPNPADADVIDVDVDGVIAGAIATDGKAAGFITQHTHVALMTSLRYENTSVDRVKRAVIARVHVVAELAEGDCVHVGGDEFIVRVNGAIATIKFEESDDGGSFYHHAYDASVIINNSIVVVEDYNTPTNDNALSAARIAHERFNESCAIEHAQRGR